MRQAVWLWMHVIIALLGLYSHALAAGISKVEVPASGGEPMLKAMVWTPCATPSLPIQIGPFNLQGVIDCRIEGHSLPLIVISHGKGASMLSHHDTASALADAGFVVVALNHPGDSFRDEASGLSLSIFESRVRDISRTVSFMTERWSEREFLDSKAIGVFGFSRGGYTALALAGAKPHLLSAAKRLCEGDEASKNILCHQFKDKTAALDPPSDPRIRAIVVADPLNLFDAQGLKSIHIPMQLWASEYGGDGVTLGHNEEIRQALPLSEFHVAQGAGHFAFLAPCPPALIEENREICIDLEGFDRVAWHAKMNHAIVDFFKQQLLRH